MSIWNNLIDQDDVINVLRKAVKSANNTQGQSQSMTHAWLVTGPPGSGRSNAAKYFACALQCENPQIDPQTQELEYGCGECKACVSVLKNTHPDVTQMATEKVIINREEVQELVSIASQAPIQGKWRVIIVEDADRMTEVTSNVLLKSIEEPPAKTVWILCSPTPNDVIVTIRSRCRNLNLKTPSVEAVTKFLVEKESIEYDVARQAVICAQSHVGMARYLARNPQARINRRELITSPIKVRNVVDAVFVASDLLELATKDANERNEEKNIAEKTALLKSMGLEEGEKVPLKLNSQIKQLEEEQKRRMTRSIRDNLDRIFVDLLGLYRDVLVCQLQSNVSIINIDLEADIKNIATESTVEQTLARMENISKARNRLQANVNPLLVIESLVVSLRPQAFQN